MSFRRPVLSLLALLAIAAASTVPAQQTNPPATPAPPQPRAQLFGGTVTALTRERITVTRSAIGHKPEQRQFLITSATKMSKAVAVRSKVTVRYRHLPQGDVALEIRLHLQTQPARPS